MAITIPYIIGLLPGNLRDIIVEIGSTDVPKGHEQNTGIEVQTLINQCPLHQILGIELIRLGILAHQIANDGM